jgi:hypothetical protein
MYLADTFFDGNIDFEISKSKYSKTGNSGQDSMAGGTYPPAFVPGVMRKE